ncbi:Rhodanese-related sulfurtransferase [Methanophagales archaeon]|nr:Rhodanese-related sulfurtransferase [Methanophagales archaeon]
MLHAEVIGKHSVSAIASNPSGTDMQTWIWDVLPTPTPTPTPAVSANVTETTDTTYINITAGEAKQMIDESSNIVILDVRTFAEYESGHVAGAESMPLSKMNCEACRHASLDKYKSKDIIVYCKSGVKSEKASNILVNNGFENVYNMLGGVDAWVDAGFRVVTNSIKEIVAEKIKHSGRDVSFESEIAQSGELICPISPPEVQPRGDNACFGACGGGCPGTCDPLSNIFTCGTKTPGGIHFVCKYTGVIKCGTHQGCRDHDKCYQRCRDKGIDCPTFPRPKCCKDCDDKCTDQYGYWKCFNWMRGKGTFDGYITYANEPILIPCEEPTPYCVDGKCVECRTNADCDDGDPCTTDTCVDGECVHEQIQTPECCSNTGMSAMQGSSSPPTEPPTGNARAPSYSASGSMGPSGSASYTTPIGPSTSEAFFGIRWGGSDLNLILHSPDGTTIDPSSNISSVYYVQNATCEYYIILNPEPGTWTMDVKPIDVPESGENYTVFVYEGDDAVFNDIYSDYGTAAVGGWYERINVEVGVNITVPGLYKVNGSLYDANGNEAILVSKETYLDVGNQSVTLKFYGMRQPGAYYLRNLTLYEVLYYGVVKALDHRGEAYTTRVYHDLDPNPQLAMLTGHYADHGTDVDGDELYEFLTVDVGVNVILPGQYTLIGYLYDLNWSEVVWSIDHEIFEVGYHTMHLDFDGKTIEKHGVNGPYRLGNLFLAGRNWTVKDAVWYAYTTSMYNSSDFVDPVRTEKVISGNGSGELALTVTVQDTAPVFLERYSYDLVGINVPPISTPWNRTTPGYGYDFLGVSIPGKPNNYTVTAVGVENLNIGLKQLRGNRSRTWITTRIEATENSTATETDLISPGNYHVKIFGDAAENVSLVDLTLALVKNVVVNGRFNLSINTTGFPSADYSIIAKAINGSFCFDEIAFDGLLLAP